MKDKKIKRLNFFASILVVVAICIWSLALVNVPAVFSIASLKFAHPISTSYMRYNALRHPMQGVKYRWVKSSDISKYLKDAVVIAEDDRFYYHNGLDWDAIKHAAKINWKKKKFVFGGSTISQQLVRNLYLSPSKDPLRKTREVILAVFLDSYLSKDRILELYLNLVQFGPGIYGAEAAAEHYFKGSAKNLNASQSAFLASILPNPVRKGRAGFQMNRRAQSILGRIR